MKGAVALWPSVGEYFAYDELLYGVMSTDERRNQAYERALTRCAPGRVVVDIGTGAEAVLARIAARAGARRVFAVEADHDACEIASETVADSGLASTIEVIRGFSTDIDLPEACDICVSELIGSIGSAEGCVPILKDARRLLRPGGEFIPRGCVTLAALVRLPDGLRAEPHFDSVAAHYAEKIFSAAGGPFALRLCLSGDVGPLIVSEPRVFESLNFATGDSDGGHAAMRFRVACDTVADGLVFWPQLQFRQERLDGSAGDCPSWPPAFVPLFAPGVKLTEGTCVEVQGVTRYHGMLPDYEFTAIVDPEGPVPRRFWLSSPSNASDTRMTTFHERLLTAQVAA